MHSSEKSARKKINKEGYYLAITTPRGKRRGLHHFENVETKGEQKSIHNSGANEGTK